MNATPIEHEVEWLTPAPLWGTAGANPRLPALVRLDGDDFMDEFAHLLASGRAAELWAARSGVPSGSKAQNVLYQSVHGCYALVGASLTCRAAGRPEKAVAPGRGDSVGFVLRRVETDRPPSAWVPAGSGEGSWQTVTGDAPEAGEEVIPLFPVLAAGPPPRRVWAGLVPTASRETYLPAPPEEDPAAEDWRIAALKDGPLAVLAIENAGGRAGDEAALQAALALADFVNDHFLPLGDVPKDGIVALLNTHPIGPKLAAAGVKDAMLTAWKVKDQLHGTEPRADDYPGPTGGFTLPLPAPKRAAIQTAVEGLVPAGKKSVLPASGRPSPKFDVDFEGTRAQKYVVRCVYLRKDCPPVVSAASEPFSIAAIHDPDAPARTIRIPMPVDISINGLRKLKKNVGFVLSKELNARVQALSGKKLKQIDEGDISDGGIGLAEVCTFAMPIIMICAMIVLFVFLVLLNIVFFWMPFLKICLPIPKAKP